MSDEVTPERQCFVCFATGAEDPTAAWVKPCRCRGSTKWVHQRCLQRWIDVKQDGDRTAPVECHQCRTAYRIRYPPMNALMRLLSAVDQSVSRFCPFLSGVFFFGSVYWSAVTYGALTVMQILGRRRALLLIRTWDPWLLLFALPSIPLTLIFGHLVQWEDRMTNLIAHMLLKDPTISVFQPLSTTRVLCGALTLPMIASKLGDLWFSDVVRSPFRRTLYGGGIFLAVKGVFGVYFRYQHLVRNMHRVVLDFDEDGSSSESSSSTIGGSDEDSDDSSDNQIIFDL